MPLNNILAVSETLDINDQKIVGQTLSRSLHIATAEYVSSQAFTFTLSPMKYLLYSQNRNLLSELRVADKAAEQYLNFTTTGWVNYVAYQGELSSTQIASCAWQTTSANKNLILGSLPTVIDVPATKFIVKAGDFCQVGRYSYIATANVLRGTGTTVTIPVHRNLITPLASPVSAVIGQYGTTVSMGGTSYTGITMPTILTQYPTYVLTPITNDSFIAWNGNFVAYEAIV